MPLWTPFGAADAIRFISPNGLMGPMEHEEPFMKKVSRNWEESQWGVAWVVAFYIGVNFFPYSLFLIQY